MQETKKKLHSYTERQGQSRKNVRLLLPFLHVFTFVIFIPFSHSLSIPSHLLPRSLSTVYLDQRNNWFCF